MGNKRHATGRYRFKLHTAVAPTNTVTYVQLPSTEVSSLVCCVALSHNVMCVLHPALSRHALPCPVLPSDVLHHAGLWYVLKQCHMPCTGANIGKRVGLSKSEGAYWHKIAGGESPGDLEACNWCTSCSPPTQSLEVKTSRLS